MGEWRADWEARFAALLRDGLPAVLSVQLSPGWHVGEPALWVINLRPLADPMLWAPRDFGWDYHLSLAQDGAITAEELAAITADFDGRQLTVRFGERHGGYLTVVGELGDHPAVRAAHARGQYSDRELHVSM
jgi:hypothetical protein